MEDCIFCKIVKGKIPSEKLDESENFIVVGDANPVAEGHCLIIPKEHYEVILHLPSEFGNELIELAKKQTKRLLDSGLADGVKLVQNNYEASGQVVKHFHLHVIPEKNDRKRTKHV
jgi:histidine triad (HIT) family protein